MGYGAFYVICPRASSQYVTPLNLDNIKLHFIEIVLNKKTAELFQLYNA